MIGRKRGARGGKAVICAHYDTKPGTPGALHNASGMAALLLAVK
ncbi:MAG: M28 family peptidase [Bacillota bacterium]